MKITIVTIYNREPITFECDTPEGILRFILSLAPPPLGNGAEPTSDAAQDDMDADSTP